MDEEETKEAPLKENEPENKQARNRRKRQNKRRAKKAGKGTIQRPIRKQQSLLEKVGRLLPHVFFFLIAGLGMVYFWTLNSEQEGTNHIVLKSIFRNSLPCRWNNLPIFQVLTYTKDTRIV